MKETRVVITGVGVVDGRTAGDVRELVDETEVRRLSRVCRMTVAAGRLALADAGFDTRRGLGLVVGTEFGDLRSLTHATAGEICRIKGAGPAKTACIKAALELANRCGARRFESLERFTSPSQVFEHFHYEFRDCRKEYFLVLLLDGKNRILKRVQISEGSLNQSIVHPREVFNQAVRESAAAVILIHNHPTGDPTPSREDLDITRRL